MFARIKKSGKYQYLQIVENRKEGKKVKQRVLATLREQKIYELVGLEAKKIGPSLIFERVWKETGIQKAIRDLLTDRRF